MAGAMGRASFLPTIKCSSCGAEIEISMMVDHLCSTAPEASRLPEPSFPFKATPRSARTNDSSSGVDLLKPGRRAPPMIDPQAANRPFIRQDQLTPVNNPSGSRSVSPLTPDEGRAPFPAPFRSATSPLPRSLRAPTPELESNLDCAFPRFPVRTPRTAPTEGRKGGGKSRMERTHAEHGPPHAPLSPRTTGGDNVLQRMNTIVPGPFGVRSQTSGADQPRESAQSSSHQTNRSSKDSAASSGRNGPRSPAQRPSTAGSEKSQRRIGFDASEFRKKGFFDQTTVSSGSEKRGFHVYQSPPRLPEEDQLEIGKDSHRPENRSGTFPMVNQSKPLPRRLTDQSQAPFDGNPSTPGSLGHNKYGDSSYSPWGRESPQSRGRGDITYHARTLSRSSNGSGSGSGSGSDVRTASSRSSPPASETYRKPHRKPSHNNNIDDLMKEIQTSMKTPQSTSAVTKEPEIQLPQPPETSDPPRDPSMNGKIIPPRDPSPREDDNESHNRRPTTAKGNCRGCGEPIKGKSVSSADGRLTGRYHKQCFVCKTCREPFETVTFYVMQNNPFCERHYHQLNNSLCHTCDQGIEGQYLETERKQKYHKYCFKCHECQMVLRDDYYEYNREAYCERHAFRLAQKSDFLGPGRRNPERRTTRLMTMI